jgi:hypothetical protein
MAKDFAVATPFHRPTPEQMAQWCVTTCITFGASVSTAYKVAGAFAEAMERMAAEARHGPPEPTPKP